MLPPDHLLFANGSPAHQTLPVLRPGTAAKGRIDTTDQVGCLRLKPGQKLTVLAQLDTDAAIVRPDPSPRPDTEVLVLLRDTVPA